MDHNLSQQEKAVLSYLKDDEKRKGRKAEQIAHRFKIWANNSLVRSICATLINKDLIILNKHRYYYGKEEVNKDIAKNDRVVEHFGCPWCSS